MLLWGLMTLALAGVALGDASHCCSAEDKREVQHMWSGIWSAQFTGRRVAIGQAVFADLFANHPDAKDLFKRVNVDDPNSPEFKAHVIRVVNGLDVAINLLDDPATLDEQLAHLSHQHQERKGVKAEHFTHILTSFEHVLPQVAPCFNSDAWNRCFHRIADGISSGLP